MNSREEISGMREGIALVERRSPTGKRGDGYLNRGDRQEQVLL